MNSGRSGKLFVLVLVWLAIIGGGAALYKFYFAAADTLQVPFILWGGDVATFHANRGVETEKGSLFAKHGLNIVLVDGNDFDKQVEDYLNGNSNFLRGTMSMLGQASEKLSKETGAQPVVFLQMTWSAGDHLVARSNIKTLADLKGKRIALQKRGPHVGMLHDILMTAELGWNEKAAGRKGFIHVIWTDDVDGPNGPAGKLKSDSSIDACFAITPEKDDLVGDPDRKKAGAVTGAHVLISTEHMSRSIADVYACRKDFYDSNPAVIQKFTAAYLKACEELLTMKKQNGAEYRALLTLSQKIFTEKKIPSEEDARGLVDDAGFVGLTGNESFFLDRGNLSGFRAKMKAAQDVAMALGDAQSRHAFASADLDYAKIEKLSELVVLRGVKERFPQDIKALPNSTVFSFNVYFDARQEDFAAEVHEESFQRALEQASLFGNCLIKMRGHTDALSVLAMYVEAGVNSKKLEPQGEVLATFTTEGKRDIPVNGTYRFKDGGILDLRDPKTCGRIAELLGKDDFGNPNIMKQVDKLAMLSAKRTNNAKSELIKYAAKHKINLESNQIQAEGVGMREPANPLQLKELDVTANRRVEIRIERVKVSDLNPGGIDR